MTEDKKVIQGNQLKAGDMNASTPAASVSMGLNTAIKTSGVVQRGAGAATKGKTARGPMA